MRDVDRFRFLGAYTTPRVRAGGVLTCEARDCDVIVTGYTDARIPWPVGRRKGTSARGPVVYGDLSRAVRREANLAVCYWFGVTPWTVSKWRKAHGVEMTNAGTHELRKGYGAEEWFALVRAKAHAVPFTDERRRKVADRCRGKKQPAHVVEAMRAGRTGKPQSEEARAKMRAAWAARGPGYHPHLRPWTEPEDDFVRTLPAPEAARRCERTLGSVYNRRVRLKLPDGRAANGRRPADNNRPNE